MGKRELVAKLSVSSWCLVIVGWLFLAVPWVCLQFVIVVFSDNTHLLFLYFKEMAILNIYYGKTIRKPFDITNEVEDLRYIFSAHKSV